MFLNNDVEIISENWLEELLGHCQREKTGIVGARLYYPDDTIQHAGIVIGIGGVAGNVFVGQTALSYRVYAPRSAAAGFERSDGSMHDDHTDGI